MGLPRLRWIAALALFIPIVVFAAQISVPSAPGSGYFLASTSTGAYVATSTPFFPNGITVSSCSGCTTNSASTTLLIDNNTFSGIDAFSKLLRLTATTSALLSTDQNGNVIATTSVGSNYITGQLFTVNGISFSGGDTKTITAASSTLLANNNTFSGKNIFGQATSSSFADTALGSALALTASDGAFLNYGGTSCANQFPRSLNALGVATCATVANTDLAHSTIVVNNTTLTLGDPADTITAASSTLLGDINTWTKLQTINSASTTNFTASASEYLTNQTAYKLLATDANDQVISSSTIADNFLPSNVSAGSCTSCNVTFNAQGIATTYANGSGGGITWPWNAFTNYGTSTISTTTPYEAFEGIFASSTSHFVNADFVQSTSTSFYDSGQTASTLAAFDQNKQLISSSTVGMSFLTGTLPISKGGTGVGSFVTTGGILIFSSTLNQVAGFTISGGGVMQAPQASSTLFSAQGTSWFGGTATDTFATTGALTLQDADNSWSGISTPTRYLTLSQASTTWGVGTTSNQQVLQGSVIATFAGTIKNAKCLASSTAAFLGIAPFIGATSLTPSYFVASNTVGTETFTSNNTFTTGQQIGMYAGTSTALTNNLGVVCTFQVVQTS